VTILGDRHIVDDDYEPDKDETIMVAAVRPVDMLNEFQRDIMIGVMILEDLFPDMPFYEFLRENNIIRTPEEFDGLCNALSIVESCFGHYLTTKKGGEDILKSIFDEVNERVSRIGVAVDMPVTDARNLIRTVNSMSTDDLDEILENLGLDPEGDDEVDP